METENSQETNEPVQQGIENPFGAMSFPPMWQSVKDELETVTIMAFQCDQKSKTSCVMPTVLTLPLGQGKLAVAAMVKGFFTYYAPTFVRQEECDAILAEIEKTLNPPEQKEENTSA